jgi:hypothetical protein
MLAETRRAVLITALATFTFTALVGTAVFGFATLPKEMKLDNSKVKVTMTTYDPGVPRDPYIRPTDQVIVFLDDCKYERKDSKTGEKTIRERKSGDVIWHDKGEDAPQLTNVGSKAYRTLTIELKASADK